MRAACALLFALCSSCPGWMRYHRRPPGTSRMLTAAAAARRLCLAVRALQFLSRMDAVPQEAARYQQNVDGGCGTGPENVVGRDADVLEPAQSAKCVRAEQCGRRSRREHPPAEVLAL